MHIGYILTIGFLVVWIGIKIAEKIKERNHQKELEAQTVYVNAERSDIDDLIL